MANLIDSTYFSIGEKLITDRSELADAITQAITQYEPEILKKLLGYTLNKDLVANPSSTKWAAFITGSEFEHSYNGITQTLKWEGLTNTLKESLIAYYTFYKYTEREATKNSTVGITKPMAENSKVADPRQKMINAYDRMLDLYGRMPVCFDYSRKIQPSTAYNDLPSAYNYLLANISDFEDWYFTPIGSINIFGI